MQEKKVLEKDELFGWEGRKQRLANVVDAIKDVRKAASHKRMNKLFST